jgi:hypothetical protein
MTDERGLEPSLPAELEALAGAINAEHRACETALRAGLAHAIKAGELLIEAKDLCPHGTWLPWLRDNFDGRERLARAYMQVARELPKLQAENGSAVADLSFREALAALAVREPVRVVVHHVPVPPAEPVTLVVRDVPAPPREPGSVGDRSGERVYRVGELWAVACRPAPPGAAGGARARYGLAGRRRGRRDRGGVGGPVR